MTPTLHILGSSSKGNGYIIDTGKEQLILECGVAAIEALRVLRGEVTRVAAALCTHKHIDHAKYIFQYQRYGIPVYSCQSVADNFSGVMVLEEMKRYKIGGFTILSLKVPHGDCECYSYIIDHPDLGRLLFATDLKTLPYNIKEVCHALIECNYIQDLVVGRVCGGEDIRSQQNKHMELDTSISVIRRLYSHKMMNVVLLHLSDVNSDVNVIRGRFKSELGIEPIIAENNFSILLNREEF